MNVKIKLKITMPDHKQMCKNCKTRQLPPTGKNCQKKKEELESNNELF